MYQIRKKLRQFCAAHRVLNDYQGRCRYLHGHNYSVTVTFSAKKLNQYGFVVDFADVRRLCEQWIQQHFDHGVLVSERDQSLLDFLQTNQQRYFVLSGQDNTSAESIARFLFNKFSELLVQSDIDQSNGLSIIALEVAETEESSAVFSLFN